MKTTVLTLVCVFSILLFTASKCKKETPPKAIVTVSMEDGKVVVGAAVKVYSDPTYYGGGYNPVGYYSPDEKKLYDIQTTDANGQTHHSFKYESIYSVKASIKKKIGPHASDTLWYVGEGALILRNNQTFSESVVLHPQN